VGTGTPAEDGVGTLTTLVKGLVFNANAIEDCRGSKRGNKEAILCPSPCGKDIGGHGESVPVPASKKKREVNRFRGVNKDKA